MSPYVSIIVPVYNSERYLQECIDTILAQSFTDFEIILVNDGSKDNSGKICDNNALKDSRIKVIYQANSGVTAARRNGLEHARGEWISFIDSDDTIPQTAIEALVQASESFDCDFVVGHLREVQIIPPSIISLDRWREICISGVPLLPGPWCRLIRRSLFDNWTLDIPRDIIKGEDMLMNIRLAFNMTKNVVEVHQKVYNYRENFSSCVHTFIQDAAYEERYHQLRMQSIPAEYHDCYLKASVHKRVLMLNEIYVHKPLDVSWIDTVFYKDLMCDIKTTNYHLKPILKLKFCKLKNPLYRWILAKLVKFDDCIYIIKCHFKTFIKKGLSRSI